MNNKKYNVLISDEVEKKLKKMDKFQAKLLLEFIYSKLENSEDPRIIGKALLGNKKGFWRYRVGNYRIIADIKDNELIIMVINVGHRKNIY